GKLGERTGFKEPGRPSRRSYGRLSRLKKPIWGVKQDSRISRRPEMAPFELQGQTFPAAGMAGYFAPEFSILRIIIMLICQ
ncbi:MAG: hypothetical protein U9N73_03545, partial [Candidatus Auribacterota bacterium]|nr:hypothetical protein [Candidatus Auribacterota bacterium]